MIKAIIFDFDGVILESADIKTKAFKELFSGYPQKIGEIVRYHLLNAGISRYIKFQYIYDQILRQKLSKDTEIELEKRFSKIVLKKILRAPFVPGTAEFLNSHKNKYQFFIASGTPEEELLSIIFARGLHRDFKEIHGSPKKKTDIIIYIIDKYGFKNEEVVYIGDAQSDRIAAEEAGVVFIERRSSIDSKLESNPYIISDLFTLSEVLKKIEN